MSAEVRAYLDHAATTPLRPEAREAMLPWLGGRSGNASGAHALARRARQAADEARDEIAELLGCQPGELIFTSGGTEADNLAVHGRAGLVVCSAIEHHAVRDPVLALGGDIVPVDADGVIDLDALPSGAEFVSVMLVNNEIGTVQPLSAVRDAVPHAVLHTDAVQAVSWLDMTTAAASADLVSITGHKFGGPQGVGALVARRGVTVHPMLFGGGQERGLRSGTTNVAGIVGLAAALRACHEQRPSTAARLADLRDRLADGLIDGVRGCVETGARRSKVAGFCSLAFDGVESEALLVLLDRAGVCASAGASCSSGAAERSYVLIALGVSDALAGGALRLTLGWDTTDSEVDIAVAVVRDAVEQVQRFRGMKVLVAMSGGVDSSVAAAMLRDAGYDVTGVTMRLWGGASDTGCCSVADVDDARRVAQQLGVDHFVFNFADDFVAGVVEPYVASHRSGRTPNPCIECNRTIKFDRLLLRARLLGFDAVATGHHAQIVRDGDQWRLRRGADQAKDQSYVLSMLDQARLARIVMPVGACTKADVRAMAASLGLRTADKPDSQDVCFITRGSRAAFIGERTRTTPGRVVDTTGAVVGEVPAVELMTVGQRRGLQLAGAAAARYVVDVDVASATVTVGGSSELLVDDVRLVDQTWIADPVGGDVLAQCSAHGEPRRATLDGAVLHFAEPVRRVAPGQTVALYRGDDVVGGAIVA